MSAPTFHEAYDRDHAPRPSSNRAFGLVMSLAAVVVACWPLRVGGPARPFGIAVAALLLVAAVAWPGLLGPLNALWTKLAVVMARVTNPVVMAVLFFAVITPAGWVARRAGWLTLIRKAQPERDSYWIARTDGRVEPDSLRRQF